MRKNDDKSTKWVLVFLALVLVTILAAALLSSVRSKEEMLSLRAEIDQQRVTILDYEDLLAEKEEQLAVHKELLGIFQRQSSNAAYDFSQIRQMVSQATQTVEDLKKLEESDGELLAKYSKVYFLNEHYYPENLTYLPNDLLISERNQQIKKEVLPFLTDMLAAMRSDGLSPRIVSAFRSFDYQGELKNSNVVTYGTSVASQFVADQGYSEHQLGTTVDIANPDTGAEMLGFDITEEYQWLLDNAYKYGFILSYPEDNSYYAFEPWHWRFVGIALATELNSKGKYFYDMLQRDINTYRINMFDTTQ
ncbi:hypothetical protein CL652_01140 [bacterium]|nr:hypothetical protein [bacterium]|tara:strand:+ start:8591 stop:9508 length:918 start_codon:yes stop_codon:yes gene_type:complete